MPFSGIAMDLQKSAPASNEICWSQIPSIFHLSHSLGKEFDYGWVNSVKPENVVASPRTATSPTMMCRRRKHVKAFARRNRGLGIMEVLVEYPTLALSGRVTTS
jgi:hypothetical protein